MLLRFVSLGQMQLNFNKNGINLAFFGTNALFESIKLVLCNIELLFSWSDHWFCLTCRFTIGEIYLRNSMGIFLR